MRMSRKAERAAWTAHITGEQAPKRGKYLNASKEECGGYDSKHEMDLAAKLHALASSKQILQLVEKPRWEIVPADPPFTATVYIADFSYVDLEGSLHVLDAKGVKTQVYLLKKKLMWHVHKIKIEEVYAQKQKRRAFMHRLPHK